MKDTESEILTLDEVAAYLKAGKRTVYRLAAAKKIPAFKLGGTWRFRRSELARIFHHPLPQPKSTCIDVPARPAGCVPA